MRRPMRNPKRLMIMVAAPLAIAAPAARAQLPYPAGVNQPESSSYRLAPGQTPSNFSDSGDWELTGTPNTSLTSQLTVDRQPDQLCGIRGISLLDAAATQPASCVVGQPVKTAFEVSTGNPDVHIAVLDSGIEWNRPDVMANEADKVWLNTGELPAPRHDLATPLAPLPGARTCASLGNARGGDYDRYGNYWPTGHGGNVGGAYDILGSGAVNLLDWACDSRVARALYPASLNPGLTCPGQAACKPTQRYHGPTTSDGKPVLTPEALILAFSDGTDHDHNGYANDIAGWNFVDNTNDPYDDVQYGHGSGEARDSTAEADTGSTVGSCPNCMIMPLRVGESFVTDANRFAQAALYATDQGADVIQEALGTYNAPYFARQAIEYAYNHGTTVIASAADEAAEHHNQPGALPDTIVVNSVNQPDSVGGVGATNVPPSYLQLNGCTNWGPRVTLAVEGSSCSSESTGKSAGVTGLIYSAAENALNAGKLTPSGTCRRVDGTPCIITPNEVRQLLASGNIAGDATAGQTTPSTGSAPADQGDGGQADDVNFAAQPEGSCVQQTPSCTDPNQNTTFAADMLGGVLGPAPNTYQYPARKGFDQFYGYGRLNAFKSVAAAAAGAIPPEADITSPDWFTQVDPAQTSFELDGYVNARVPYTCRIDVAPGVEPNNALASASPPGDFHTISSAYCDGSTVHTGARSGGLAAVDVAYLKSLFPSGDPSTFTGNENGGQAQPQFGRPNTQPYGFTVRVVVSTASGPRMTGEDRRQLFLHRDRDMLAGWPKELRTDGDSSPILADLESRDRNDLIVASSDGWIHAYRSNGSEAPGWPVHTDPLASHPGEAAYGPGGVGSGHYTAVLGGLAAGDLFHDGGIEVVAADMAGNVYAWSGHGRLVFHAHSNPAYSGTPLDYPKTPSGGLDNVRRGPRDRTEGGFLGSPVLANLNGGPGPLDIIVAGEDRHLYAWQPNGRPVPGFPVLVADPDKITGFDSATNHLTFSTTRAKADPGISEDQGKIVDTPAVAYVNGPGKPPVIYLGTNEEYTVNTGDEGPINAGGVSSAALGPLGQTGVLTFANGRVYAIKPTGGAMTCSGVRCGSSAFEPGWPVKIGIIDEGLLPDVGEGINGSPIVAPISCPNGGGGMKIGVSPDAGPAYLLNGNGSSCYGSSGGQYNTLDTNATSSNGQKDDTPAFAAVGYPAFGTLDGKTISMFDQGAGLLRALDVAVNGEQKGGQDFILGWDTASGRFRSGYPAIANDLGFLTGETVGAITSNPSQQDVLGGTASLDVQAFDPQGQPASAAWPKLSGDWLVATPTLGSFGTLDYSASARKDVVTVTRSGTLAVYSTPAAACSPSSWPNFHHDIANSGDYTRDAVGPGAPLHLRVSGGRLTFVSPGNDLMCGKPAGYEVVTANGPFTAGQVSGLRHLVHLPAPVPAGQTAAIQLPATVGRCLGVRAVDPAGNLGPTAVLATRAHANCGPPIAAPGVAPNPCPRAAGRLAGTRLGSLRLGMTRAGARRVLPRFSTRGRRYMDFFCLSPIGIRVGYPSPGLLRTLSRSGRRRVAGRVVLALSADRHYALRGVRPGRRLAAAAGLLHTGRGFRIGLNTWYLAPDGSARGVLKVRHGVIEEVGIADKRLTASRRPALSFLRSFQGL
ncbi:MAG: S8 family serine peptidase [Actinomycetota bacterium]|nr:S8 family serine peptidase [Actinomycetota bacterium]